MDFVIRPELTNADGAEVTQYLIDLGFPTNIQTEHFDEGMFVRVEGKTEDEIHTALDGFTPTAAAGEWPGLLPEELRSHAAHIRDFGRLDAAGIAALPVADRWHVLRDVCRALALLVDNRLD